MTSTEQKWLDGTPKSAGNAFDWRLPKVDQPLTRIEKERAYAREYWRRKRDELKQAATRINPCSNIATSAGITNSRKAPR